MYYYIYYYDILVSYYCFFLLVSNCDCAATADYHILLSSY